jgi:hypothetical protein
MKGYVYALTNDHMPGLVKIGRTTGDPERRASQLYQTGVPSPFRVLASVMMPDCAAGERNVHQSLDPFRVSGSREFFRVCRDQASFELERELRSQMLDIVAEFMPDHVVVHSDLSVCEVEIAMKADAAGEPDPIIATAMEEATVDELRPAIARVYAKMAKVRAAREAQK